MKSATKYMGKSSYHKTDRPIVSRCTSVPPISCLPLVPRLKHSAETTPNCIWMWASTPRCANLAHSHTRFVMLFDWKALKSNSPNDGHFFQMRRFNSRLMQKPYTAVTNMIHVHSQPNHCNSCQLFTSQSRSQAQAVCHCSLTTSTWNNLTPPGL